MINGETVWNHNHFSGLLEMIMPLALGLAFYHWRKAHSRSARRIFGMLGDPDAQKCFLLLVAATVMLVAIVFSISRMGMISALVSLGVIAAVLWAARRRSPFPAALAIVLLAAGVTTVSWLGVGPIVERFEQLPQNEPLAGANAGRMALWRDAAKLVRAHPLAGACFGCFEYAFTRVQSTELAYTIDHAHNDYLELAIELGLPGAALLFAAFFRIAFRTLQASLRAPSNLARSLALGALGGISALVAHSAADFNLAVPANALLFAAVLAMGYAASLEERASAREKAPARAVRVAAAEPAEAAVPVSAAARG